MPSYHYMGCATGFSEHGQTLLWQPTQTPMILSHTDSVYTNRLVQMGLLTPINSQQNTPQNDASTVQSLRFHGRGTAQFDISQVVSGHTQDVLITTYDDGYGVFLTLKDSASSPVTATVKLMIPVGTQYWWMAMDNHQTFSSSNNVEQLIEYDINFANHATVVSDQVVYDFGVVTIMPLGNQRIEALTSNTISADIMLVE